MKVGRNRFFFKKISIADSQTTVGMTNDDELRISNYGCGIVPAIYLKQWPSISDRQLTPAGNIRHFTLVMGDSGIGEIKEIRRYGLRV